MRFYLLNDDTTEGTVEDVNHNSHHITHEVISQGVSIEGLRRIINTCSNCGVCWKDDHVSLDCVECDGYAMQRPCPMCNGVCGSIWHRDVQESRNTREAQWIGECARTNSSKVHESSEVPQDSNANYQNDFHSSSQTLVNKSHHH